MKQRSLYPRGNALTDTMPFTDRHGVRWLVYIEGVPPDRPPRHWGQAVLPGRLLRFDSATESRTSIQVPAGSPYLTDRRLQSLLDQAQSVLAGPRSPAAATRARRPLPGESGARRLQHLWKRASERAPPLVNRVEQFVSAVLATMQALEGAMRSGLRRARR